MARVFISPSKYVQGPGELAKLGSYVASYGKKALVVISAGGIRRSGDVVRKSFADANVAFDFDEFNGECSQDEIDRHISKDPDTGEEVQEEITSGKIRITHVSPQNSKGEIIEDTGIEPQAIVRMKEEAPAAE